MLNFKKIEYITKGDIKGVKITYPNGKVINYPYIVMTKPKVIKIK